MLKNQWGSGHAAAGFAIRNNISFLSARNANGQHYLSFIPVNEHNTGYIANATTAPAGANTNLVTSLFNTNGADLVWNFLTTTAHFNYSMPVPNGVGTSYNISFNTSNTTYYRKYIDTGTYGNKLFLLFNRGFSSDFTNNTFVYLSKDSYETSTDSWDEHPFPAANVNAAIYAPNVNLYAVVTEQKSFLTSPDGINWTYQANNISTGSTPSELEYDQRNKAFYLRASNFLYYSTNNGASWSNVTSSLGTGGLTSLYYDNVNSKMIIAGTSFVGESPAPANQIFTKMLTSTSLGSYSSSDVTGANITVQSVVCNNNPNDTRFIAVGESYDQSQSPVGATTETYLHSTNGTSWTVGTLDFPIAAHKAVYFSGERYD